MYNLHTVKVICYLLNVAAAYFYEKHRSKVIYKTLLT